MRTLLSILAICFTICNVNAQSVKVIDATSQSWSGGIYGHSGVNYMILLECHDTTKNITIDTVWIGNKSYYNSQQTTINVVKKIAKGKFQYRIAFGESRDLRDTDALRSAKANPNKNSPCRGKGCVVYHSGRKKEIIEIDKITSLSPLAYP